MRSSSELRYAVLLDGPGVPVWQLRCLEELNAVEGVRPVLVVECDPEPADPAPEARAAWRRRLWDALRRRLDPASGAMEPVALDDRDVGDPPAPRMRAAGAPDGSALAEVGPIRDREPDFVLHLARRPPPESLLDVAPHGVWVFGHGTRRREGEVDRDRDGEGDLPFAARAIDRGDSVVEVTLERLDTEPHRREVLHRGRFAVVDDSWRQTRDAALLGAVGLPARVCREILASGEAGAVPIRVRGLPAADSRTPTAASSLRIAGTLARNYVRNALGELFRHEQWTIGVVSHPPEALLEADRRIWIRWLPCPSRRFYRADPFGVEEENGVLRVVLERFDYDERRGRLVSLAIPPEGGDGDVSEASPAGLPWEGDGDAHVSYPYLFRHGGVIHCVPETAEAGAARLYRARRFPSDWELAGTLIDGFPALDPTVFRHEGRWWLFCSDGSGSGRQYRLHAWWAPELDGPWTPHALNPLKTDVRSSRPAGTPFRHRGGLYRPAQDGSGGYGSAVALNRVVELTPTRFREATVAYLTPDPEGPFPHGIHTVARVGDRTLVDGVRKVFIPSEFRRRVGERLRGIARRLRPRTSATRHEPHSLPGTGTEAPARSGR